MTKEYTDLTYNDETPTANSTYPKGGVSCFADTFVQAKSSVLRMKFSGENRHLRQAPSRVCPESGQFEYIN